MTKKLKIALAAAAISIAGLALTACGASSGSDASASTGQPAAGQGTSSPAGTMPPQGAGGPFASLTSDHIKCLEKQGVSVPSGPPAQGHAPTQGHEPGKVSSVKKLKKAATACDIDLPAPPSGSGTAGQAPPQGMPPTGQASGSATTTTQPPATATS